MENQTWIKLFRKIVDHDIFNDQSAFRVFMWILCSCDYKTGSMKSGRFWASERLSINPITYYKILKRLEKKYDLVTLQSNNKNTTILVKKWNLYQGQSNNESNNEVTTKEQQSNTTQELRTKNITNNAPANADVDLDKLLTEGNNRGITQEFQLLGLDIFELTNAPPDKKTECFRIAKKYPEGTIMTALSFAKDYPQPKLKWKMFLWKLNSLCKKS